MAQKTQLTARVVVLIGVGVLFMLVVPVSIVTILVLEYQGAQEDARRDACLANLRHLGQQCERHAETAGRPPERLSSAVSAVPTCPAAGADTYSAGYRVEGSAMRISCSGPHGSGPAPSWSGGGDGDRPQAKARKSPR